MGERVEPALTVVLPTYNGRRFVADQVASVLRQTVRPGRILITDDHSEDGTWEVLSEQFAGEPDVRLNRNSSNLGQERTLEHLLGSVETPYFAIADQDDVWLPWKLETTLDALERTGADLVYSDLALVGRELEPLACSALAVAELRPVRGRRPLPLLVRNPVHGCTVVARRQILAAALPFPAGIPHHDRWLALVAAARGGVGFVPEPLVLYRQHDGNSVGTVPPGLNGLRSNVRRRGNGVRSVYLRRRMAERRALTAGLVDRTTPDRGLRLADDFYASGRVRRSLLAVPYAVSMARHGSPRKDLLADVVLGVLTP